jgi:hypothetical protein
VTVYKFLNLSTPVSCAWAPGEFTMAVHLVKPTPGLPSRASLRANRIVCTLFLPYFHHSVQRRRLTATSVVVIHLGTPPHAFAGFLSRYALHAHAQPDCPGTSGG